MGPNDSIDWILVKDYFFLNFNKQNIKSTLETMTSLDDAYVILITKENKALSMLQEEKYYGTKYRVDKLDIS